MQIHPPKTSDSFTSKADGLDQAWQKLPGTGFGMVRADWSRALREAGLSTIEDFLNATGEPLMKPGLRNRYRARLVIRRNEENQIAYLKRYETDKGSFLRWLTRAAKELPAQHDMEVAEELNRNGIAAPETLAWGWTESPGGSKASFVLAKAVPGEAVDMALAREPFRSRDHETLKKEWQLIRELGSLARRFHQLGWCHRDFYLCHIFVDAPTERPKFSLIDLQRAFRPKWWGWRWRIKDLAQLNYSAKPERFSRTARLRFAKSYFGHEILRRVERQVLAKVLRKSDAIARHDRSRRT